MATLGHDLNCRPVTGTFRFGVLFQRIGGRFSLSPKQTRACQYSAPAAVGSISVTNLAGKGRSKDRNRVMSCWANGDLMFGQGRSRVVAVARSISQAAPASGNGRPLTPLLRAKLTRAISPKSDPLVMTAIRKAKGPRMGRLSFWRADHARAPTGYNPRTIAMTERRGVRQVPRYKRWS